MADILSRIGGRKFVLALVYIITIILDQTLKLELDPEVLHLMLLAVLGGAGAIALEDSVQAVSRAISQKGATALIEVIDDLIDRIEHPVMIDGKLEVKDDGDEKEEDHA